MQNFNFLNFFLMCHNSLSCTFGSEYCIVNLRILFCCTCYAGSRVRPSCAGCDFCMTALLTDSSGLAASSYECVCPPLQEVNSVRVRHLTSRIIPNRADRLPQWAWIPSDRPVRNICILWFGFETFSYFHDYSLWISFDGIAHCRDDVLAIAFFLEAPRELTSVFDGQRLDGV